MIYNTFRLDVKCGFYTKSDLVEEEKKQTDEHKQDMSSFYHQVWICQI